MKDVVAVGGIEGKPTFFYLDIIEGPHKVARYLYEAQTAEAAGENTSPLSSSLSLSHSLSHSLSLSLLCSLSFSLSLFALSLPFSLPLLSLSFSLSLSTFLLSLLSCSSHIAAETIIGKIRFLVAEHKASPK